VGAQKTIVVSKKVCETYIRTYELTNPLQCKLFPLVHATAWTLGFSTLQYTLLLSTTACLITSLLKNNWTDYNRQHFERSYQKSGITGTHTTQLCLHQLDMVGVDLLSYISSKERVRLLKHWRTDTDAGQLLGIAVSWTQLHLWTSFCFLHDTITMPLPHLPGRWLKLLWTFLAGIKGSLELDIGYLPPIQRHNDSYIMDSVLNAGYVLDSKVCQINHCQMYLQAITVSDLCLADGVLLDCDMFHGRPGPTSSTSSWIQIKHIREGDIPLAISFHLQVWNYNSYSWNCLNLKSSLKCTVHFYSTTIHFQVPPPLNLG
jgi:hypothetical protein